MIGRRQVESITEETKRNLKVVTKEHITSVIEDNKRINEIDYTVIVKK